MTLKHKTYVVILVLLTACYNFGFSQNETAGKSNLFIYHSDASADKVTPFIWPLGHEGEGPFEKSKDIHGIEFTGRYANYTKADTWYPSWAADGHLYSPWTDGSIAGEHCNSWSGPKARTGQARITGTDPMNLEILSLGTTEGSAYPYQGRYPCGSLVHDSIWYYGTYTLNGSDYGLNWPILGSFGGFRISYDMGKTWTDSPLSCAPGQTLFPEPEKLNGPLKIGAPHFVDFGKNMQHSPDGKAYMVAHGASEHDLEDRKANLSWISGDFIYLCRVTPTPENINNEAAYEYFSGNDAHGNPIWSDDFKRIQPIVDWDNNTGCVTMTYNAPLKKYIMCVTDGWPTVEKMNTYLLESENITGPWELITYMKDFGPQAYFVNIPSKFTSEDGKKMWLCYSANFTNEEHRNTPAYLKTTNPPGSAYSLSLHEIQVKE